jgi:hypothetical protein
VRITEKALEEIPYPELSLALGMIPVMLVSGVIISNEATKIIAPIS